ncbi:MAG TPA: MazG family protein [Micromonosporaceae bacterium]
MVGRIVLLVTSPRLPPGLLTAQAWDVLRTEPVLAAADSDLGAALDSMGIPVQFVPADAGAVLAAVAEHGAVVWLAGPTGDEALARDLGLRLAREPGLAELELMYGSWDPVGARLLDVVAVMDRLVSPGGDPWKREQSHQTLARYLLEEAYEAYDAIEAHDLGALREELGDVLLQVVLHARMAEEAEPAWSIDDLAGDLVAKLIRRNPHVFGDARTTDVDEIIDNWERIKREEKARDSAMDGIALSQPALALAAKVFSRTRRAGLAVPVPQPPERIDDEDALGAALLALVAQAQANGLDPEAALRRAALAQLEAVRAAERREIET